MTPFELNLQNELEIERQRFSNKWLFIWHNINIRNRTVDVDDFRGGRIHVGGVPFEGQLQQIYWQAIGRYLIATIHNIFRRWDEDTHSYPSNARRSSLEGTRQLLQGLASRTIDEATMTDRRLRGRGFPERVPLYNSSRERASAQREIFRLARSHGNLCEGEMDFIVAFNERVGRRLKDMLRDAQRENEAILVRMSAKGLGHSGSRIREQLNATQRELYRAIDWALSEANQLPGQLHITRGLVQPSLTTHLATFAEQLCSIVNSTGVPDSVINEIAQNNFRLKEILHGELRDYSQGVWRSRNLENGTAQMTTNNTVTIQGSHIGPVQQAGADSNQESNFTVSMASVESALSQLVAALSESGIDQKTKEEINAEVCTVQIQLKRSTPNLSVIRAAVTGIQQLAVGIGANMLTPHVLALLQAVGLA